MKLSGLLLVGLLGSGCVLAEPLETKFTVRVTDVETGLPITHAEVRSTFTQKRDPWGTGEGKFNQVKLPVDQHGTVVLSGYTSESGVSGRAFADGYYTEGKGFKFTRKSLVLNRWEPWDPVIEVKMRKIKNPVPMVQKRVESLKILKWGEPIGFDLEKADWIAPYGKGVRSDFFVNMYRRFEHSGDYDTIAQITFPNDGDGIQLYKIQEDSQSSSYKFPYEAPFSGYQNKLVLERHATLSETKVSFDPKNDMYIFRVRTQKDADGDIVSACYGRVDGRIEIGWGEVFDFTYHFNPNPNERSLEYNGENLLKK